MWRRRSVWLSPSWRGLDDNRAQPDCCRSYSPPARKPRSRHIGAQKHGAHMSTSHGSFVWHELMTSDPAAARTFYGDVVGWTARATPGPGMDYWMFKAGGTPV